MIPLLNLFEAHLMVSDLDAALEFYRDVVGIQPAHVTPIGDAAFFWIGAPATRCSASGRVAAHREGDDAPLPREPGQCSGGAQREALRAAGVTPRHFSGRATGGPWSRVVPAAALYFWDPDGNLL